MGGRALAIPHNGNLSNGLMFSDKNFDGKAMTREYAEKRARWEPVIEVSQIKGDEEAHPLLSPEDEFADFENWDVSEHHGHPTQGRLDAAVRVRPAGPQAGVAAGAKAGRQSVQVRDDGASSDTHTALSTTREENYFGKYHGDRALGRIATTTK